MPKKIVVADDDRQLIKLLRTMLLSHGYEVQFAHDGGNALKLIKETKPDLVILDVMMPVIDGYRICQTIIEDVQYRPLPKIIVATVRNEEIDRKIAQLADVDAFMTKPYKLEDLLAKVIELLKDEQDA